MTKCPICNKSGFKGKAGLAQHKRQVHQDPPPSPTQAKNLPASSQAIEIKQLKKQFNDFTDFITSLINEMASQCKSELDSMQTLLRNVQENFIPTEISKETMPFAEKSPPPPPKISTPWIEVRNSRNNPSNRQDSCVNLTNKFAVLQDQNIHPQTEPSMQPMQQHNLQTQLNNPNIQQRQQHSMQQHQQPRIQQRSVKPFINNTPRKDIPVAPGAQSYAEVMHKRPSYHRNQHQQNSNQHPNSQTKQQYKLHLLGDSNLNKMHPRDLSKQLVDTYVTKMAQSGATAAHLNHYADIALAQKPDGLMIHGGTNDIIGRNSQNQPANEIAYELIRIGVKAREANVRDIFISSVLVTKDSEANKKVKEINNHLKELCVAYNFVYMDNNNITQEDLRDNNYDLVHLSPTGTDALMKNFSYYFNY